MKKIKNYLLSAGFLLTALCFGQTKASAACWICFGNDCYLCSGSCDGFCPGSSSITCSAAAIMASNDANNNLNYIQADASGQAWVIQGTKKTRLASDAFVAFNKVMMAKYPKTRKYDKVTLQTIDAEWAAFRKKDDHKVSKTLLDLVSKETGIKIGGAEHKNDWPQKRNR